ncbi:MAG: co-chaperone GroES [Pseudomonadales bacterium]|nr:co-chaperone GroES [Pseudomonadales bacterium]
MKIRPLHDRVVVRREAEEEKSAGGILLTGSAKEKPNKGEVVAVGSGRVLDNGSVNPMSVKVGDKVVFASYAGSQTIKDGDDELIVMSESEIFGVIEG